MATNSLYQLFDENVKTTKDLVTSSPKTLSDMVVSGTADVSGLSTQIELKQRVLSKVDYSDFSNFVFFNSALDYFNISGDRFMREWPFDGDFNSQLQFISSSDPYQTYLTTVWPKWHGYADLTASAQNTYITTPDTGLVNGNSYAGLLAFPTASFTVEAHIALDPGITGTVVIMERVPSGSSTSSFQVFYTGSTLALSVSGTVICSSTITTGSRWVAFTVDSIANSATFYTTNPSSLVGNDFQDGPYQVFSTGVIPPLMPAGQGVFNVGASPTSITSGSIQYPSKLRVGEVRVWNTARADHELFANYNTRVYPDATLMLYWRFADGYTTNNSVVKDYSGHAMHGRIVSASASTFWVSSSFGMNPQDTGEYVLPYNPADDTTLFAWVSSTQEAATLYDRNNANIITNLVPQQFLYLEDAKNTSVLKNLLYLLGRQFDELKVKIDQFPKLLTANYTDFDQTPDALLADALRFWGWDTKSSFLNKEAFQHFFGYDVLTPSGSLTSSYAPPAAINNQASFDNQRLDMVLADIKNEFWKRTLNNLIYIYKTKGTRESVEALLRVYGLDDKIVKVKEFGLQQNVKIQTNRINSEKSCWAYHISGTNTVSTSLLSVPFSPARTYTTQIRFPITYGTDWSFTTGSIFGAKTGSVVEELRYVRDPASSTGSLVYYTTNGVVSSSVSLGSWNIFDGRWYHLVSYRTGTNVAIHLQHLDEDRIDFDSSVSATITSTLSTNYDFILGQAFTGALSTTGSEFWSFNTQVWNIRLSSVESIDHTINPFSFGSDTPERQLQLALNWQLDKDIDSGQGVVWDNTTYSRNGTPNLSCSYDRFSMTYNFIAPLEYGWNEEKIRVMNGSSPSVNEQWLESNTVSVEFNLIDALNEDISYMLSSLDNWNNLIGEPANRHRDTYPAIERFRQQYFSRLTGRINFRAFADFLDFFDRSFLDIIRKLLPARANFKGAEFVVESHMLERPKVQYTYRRHNPILVPEGTITIVGHTLGIPAAVTASLPAPILV